MYVLFTIWIKVFFLLSPVVLYNCNFDCDWLQPHCSAHRRMQRIQIHDSFRVLPRSLQQYFQLYRRRPCPDSDHATSNHILHTWAASLAASASRAHNHQIGFRELFVLWRTVCDIGALFRFVAGQSTRIRDVLSANRWRMHGYIHKSMVRITHLLSFSSYRVPLLVTGWGISCDLFCWPSE